MHEVKFQGKHYEFDMNPYTFRLKPYQFDDGNYWLGGHYFFIYSKYGVTLRNRIKSIGMERIDRKYISSKIGTKTKSGPLSKRYYYRWPDDFYIPQDMKLFNWEVYIFDEYNPNIANSRIIKGASLKKEFYELLLKKKKEFIQQLHNSAESVPEHQRTSEQAIYSFLLDDGNLARFQRSHDLYSPNMKFLLMRFVKYMHEHFIKITVTKYDYINTSTN